MTKEQLISLGFTSGPGGIPENTMMFFLDNPRTWAVTKEDIKKQAYEIDLDNELLLYHVPEGQGSSRKMTTWYVPIDNIQGIQMEG